MPLDYCLRFQNYFLKKSVILICSRILLYILLSLIHSLFDTDRLRHANDNAFWKSSNSCAFPLSAFLIPSLICHTPTGITYSGRISLKINAADLCLRLKRCSVTPNLPAKYAPAIEG